MPNTTVKSPFSVPVVRLVQGGLFIAIGVLFPQMFHFLPWPNAGSIFLPMHIPVILAGMLLGPYIGGVTGALVPLISSLAFSMPPLARMPFMVLELAAYGLLAGLFVRKLRLPVILSVVLTQIGGRLVYALSLLVAGGLLHIPGTSVLAVWSAVTTGFVGIILQLLLIPALMAALKKGGLLRE